MKEKPCLYIVIPCYNEQEVLPITAPQFLGELTHLIESGKVSDDSRILFVNDGSKDDTWKIITELSRKDPRFQGIAQSRDKKTIGMVSKLTKEQIIEVYNLAWK